MVSKFRTYSNIKFIETGSLKLKVRMRTKLITESVPFAHAY